MIQLTRGGNTSIAGNAATVVVEWSPARVQDSDVDVSAFLLGGNGRVRYDKDFVFYGATVSPCGSVRLQASADSSRFDVDLSSVPSDIEKIAFTATLSGGARFGAASNVKVTFLGTASYEMQTSGMAEAAVILAELYKKNGAWKLRAVGQGFNGGLAPLATHFGVDVANDGAPCPPAPPAPPISPPLPAPRPNLSKITLAKKGDTARLSLDKGTGDIVINLNWSRPPSGTGLWNRLLGGAGLDLDLGALIELQNGFKAVVQPLGNLFGTLDGPPWIAHSGDDRSGASAEGEFLRIRSGNWTHFKRACIFTYIYEGAPDWATAQGIVTVRVPNQPVLEVQMGQHNSASHLCAICMLANKGGQIEITQLMTFHDGSRKGTWQADLDAHYGWDMTWNRRTK